MFEPFGSLVESSQKQNLLEVLLIHTPTTIIKNLFCERKKLFWVQYIDPLSFLGFSLGAIHTLCLPKM